ncbi:MAG TPA: hypothetical protein VEX18_19875 [Polyangiaceae bacterium]|nr:hypothetical protein [Polyangiaceae bacterium]
MIPTIHASVPVSPSVEVNAASSASVACFSPEERLLVLMVHSQMNRSEGAQSSVELSAEKLENLREEARKALAAAREAREDAGFWEKLSGVLSGDLALIAQLVAIAAATVATGGTAAIVLGAIAVGASLASHYADDLGIPQEVAIGLGVAAGLASLATGNLGGGLSQFTTVSSAATSTRLIAQGTAIAATAGGAVAGKVSRDCAAEVLDHQAKVRGFETAQELESSSIDENLDRLERALASQAFIVTTGTNILHSSNRSTEAVLQNFAGMA